MGKLFALINAIGWAMSMVFAKRAQSRGKVSILGGLYLSLVVNSLINLAMFIAVHIFIPIPDIRLKGIVYFILGGCCNSMIGRGLLFLAVSKLGSARTGIIKASTPLFTLALSIIVLGEVISPANIVGIALIIVGVLLLAAEQIRGSSSDVQFDIRGIPIALVACMFMATGNLFRKMGVTEIPDSAMGVTVGSISATIVMTVFYLMYDRDDMKNNFVNFDRDYIYAGIATSVSLFFLFTSLKMIPLSIANSLTAVEPLATLIIGRFLLGKQEKITLIVCLGAASTVLGAICLALF